MVSMVVVSMAVVMDDGIMVVVMDDGVDGGGGDG